MKRNKIHVTWEMIKQQLGLEQIFKVEITDCGITFHRYGGEIEHVEGAYNTHVDEVWTNKRTLEPINKLRYKKLEELE